MFLPLRDVFSEGDSKEEATANIKEAIELYLEADTNELIEFAGEKNRSDPMKLPVLSGTEVVKKLKQIGFVVTRQKGSHVRLEKSLPQEDGQDHGPHCTPSLKKAPSLASSRMQD